MCLPNPMCRQPARITPSDAHSDACISGLLYSRSPAETNSNCASNSVETTSANVEYEVCVVKLSLAHSTSDTPSRADNVAVGPANGGFNQRDAQDAPSAARSLAARRRTRAAEPVHLTASVIVSGARSHRSPPVTQYILSQNHSARVTSTALQSSRVPGPQYAVVRGKTIDE